MAEKNVGNTHLGQPPSKIVSLIGTAGGDLFGAAVTNFDQVFPNDGTSFSIFSIPDGMTFVLTDIEYSYTSTNPNERINFVILISLQNDQTRGVFQSSTISSEKGEGSDIINLTSGIPITAPTTFRARINAGGATPSIFGAVVLQVFLQGYLINFS